HCIKQTLGGKHTLGKAGARQRYRIAAYSLFPDRVADQIIITLFAIHQKIMRIKMEAHVLWKIGQPVYRGLQTHNMTLRQQLIQASLTRNGGTESFKTKFSRENFSQTLDNGFGWLTISDERQAGQLDKWQVGKRQC